MYKDIDYIQALGGQPCLITGDGSILLEPEVKVDRLYQLSNGYCQVEKDGRFGYIDESGRLVIPFKYKKAGPFSENGLAFVLGDDDLGGYINREDEFVIPPIYESGSMFSFGFAAVSRDGEYKYIHPNGLQAINATFQYASGFSDFALAKVIDKNGKHILMDSQSRIVLSLKEGAWISDLKKATRVAKFTNPRGKQALIDASGKIVTGFYDDIIINSYSNYHPFSRDGLWGYLNDHGEEVISPIYSSVSKFSKEGIAYVEAFHPLAKNNLLKLYINYQDEILDIKTIDQRKKKLLKKFSHIKEAQNSLALALKRPL